MKIRLDFDKIKCKCSELYSRFTSSRRAMTVTAGLGLLGMLLILFSGGNKDEPKPKEPIAETGVGSQWTAYRSEAESELADILSAIDGVGDTRVMITISASEEYVYAESFTSGSGREEREYVKLKNGSSEEPLVESVKAPTITGVAVVCEGADSDRVREEVYRTVTAVLGIPSTRVYVARMK